MSMTVYIPLDTSAVACGADGVADAVKAHDASIVIIRTGSRGMAWLEPLIEIETANGRMGYGPVSAADVPAILADTSFEGSMGVVDDLPWIKAQRREMFARCGIINPTDMADYEANGGMAGIKKAAKLSQANIVDTVMTSGLRGRGGAAFPAGIKWKTVSGAENAQKYIVCNADEGDSGTFADRMIMEGDPLLLVEGMAIAGLACGADIGIIYLRSEYPIAHTQLNAAIEVAKTAGMLGDDVMGTGKTFNLTVFLGAGAYICGEETSLLESLEGKRGIVRSKPPIPALEGLFGCPTLVQNVLSFCSVPSILAEGGDWYAKMGVGRSTGTMPFQLAGNIRQGGLVELPFGVSARELIEEFGGGTRSGKPIRAVQFGGPLGAYLPADQLDVAMTYEDLMALGAGLGHGGLVVFDEDVNLLDQARYAFEFCAIESCGKCTPCRIGAVRGVELIDRIKTEGLNDQTKEILTDLIEVMEDGSLCAMGGMTPIPVKSAVANFAEDFTKSSTKGEGS
jgi:formate dehydrogenase iron-sulfur subunit